MLMLNAAMKSAHQPSLEVGGDVVDARHEYVGWVGTGADDGHLVCVVGILQPGEKSSAIPSMPHGRDVGSKAPTSNLPASYL